MLAVVLVVGLVAVLVVSRPKPASRPVVPGGLFTAVTPRVVADRRTGSTAVLTAQVGRSAPSDAQQAALLITSTAQLPGTQIWVYPQGTGRPRRPLTTVGSAPASAYTVVAIDAGGAVDVSSGRSAGGLEVSVVGWFGRTGSTFTPLAPQTDAVEPGADGLDVIHLAGSVPAGVSAVALSLSTEPGPVGGSVTLYPDGGPVPESPSLESGPDGARGFLTVGLGPDGTIGVAGPAAGRLAVQLIGYFGPVVAGPDGVTGDRFVATSGQTLGDRAGDLPVTSASAPAATAVVLSDDQPGRAAAGPGGWPAGSVTPTTTFDPVLLGPGRTVQISGDLSDVDVTGWFEPVTTPPGQLFTSSWGHSLPARPGGGTSWVAAWVAQIDSQGGRSPSINFDGSYGEPIYQAEPGTAPVGVTLGSAGQCGSLGNSTFPALTGPVPIPASARAATATGQNTDTPLIVYQPSSDTDWELWRAEQQGGHWTACDGGRLSPLDRTAGTWSGGLGLSASGISYLGTLITEADVASGAIRHVMAFTLETGECDGHVAPATRNDGDCTDPGQPPEGARMYLPATVAMPTGLSPLAQMIFVALKTYGLVLVDQTGSYVVAQAESSCDYPTPTCGPGLDAGPGQPQDPIGVSLGATGLQGIPWADLRSLPAGSY